MECQIQFNGKEFHEKKTFADVGFAVNFIMKNFDKIYSVNYQPVRVFGMDMRLRSMTPLEISKLLQGQDPFER